MRDNWTGTAADLTAALSLAPVTVVEPFDATERKGFLSCTFTCACVRVHYHSLNMEARRSSKVALCWTGVLADMQPTTQLLLVGRTVRGLPGVDGSIPVDEDFLGF